MRLAKKADQPVDRAFEDAKNIVRSSGALARRTTSLRVEQPFKVWPGIFPAAFCDRVIGHAAQLDSTPGSVTHDPKGLSRSSDVAWLSDNEAHDWVFQPLNNLIAATNRKFWGWSLSGRESLQYTQYAEGQFYGWHMDARKAPYPAEGRWGGLVRKISISVNLSDPADYEGGDFELEDTTPSPERAERRIQTLGEMRARGSAVVFPAHLHHRVTPVTRGIRRSLVGWYLGPPFV